LQNEKKSILFSTHITSDLEKIADYITFILNGQLIFSDKKENIMENYAIVKGDSKILDSETQAFFKGAKSGEFGFEALTDDAGETRKRFGGEVLVEKATLEDIMYFSKLRDADV
jgi:ABC-2 type transport system ATP-binding protein